MIFAGSFLPRELLWRKSRPGKLGRIWRYYLIESLAAHYVAPLFLAHMLLLVVAFG